MKMKKNTSPSHEASYQVLKLQSLLKHEFLWERLAWDTWPPLSGATFGESLWIFL